MRTMAPTDGMNVIWFINDIKSINPFYFFLNFCLFVMRVFIRMMLFTGMTLFTGMRVSPE